jgi:GTPase SAR1 family protein
MHGNTVDFGFPSLSEDPFSSSPLEKDDFDMLVGRHSMFDELERKITFKSANRILLVGEFGSGKTSFMQCLSARTNLHLNINRIAFSEPGVELLKDMYAQLIDNSPPHDYQKLSRELRRMIHDSRQMLPLITIDADMADFTSLETCLRSSLPFFESLPALIIIAINPQQQSLISEQLLQRFEVRTMPELDQDGIKALVERRIAKASSQPYELSSEDANRLLQLSQSGQPGSLIRVLRDAVSGTYVAPNSPIQKTEYTPEETKQIAETINESEESILESDLSDVLPTIDEDESIEEAWEATPGMTEISGFDLDLETLDEPMEEPAVAPFEETEEPDEEKVEENVDNSYITEGSLPFAGPFGGLRHRNIESNRTPTPTLEGQFRESEMGTAFWSVNEHVPIQDDIVATDEEEHDSEPLYEDIPEYVETEEIAVPATNRFDSNTIEAFTRLLTQVLQPSNAALSGDQNLIEQLQALSRPRLTQKEEHVLSVAVLSSLTSSEAVVVAEAKGRSISPSDQALLARLSIKRARLSQICNRLHKAGILHARMVGRTRMFGLTRSALAQLIAWGLVGGDE